MLEKSTLDLKKWLVRLTITLLVMSILSLGIAMISTVNAQDKALSLTPSQGPVGTLVSVIGMGYSSNTQATITFGEVNVANAYVGQMFGRFNSGFTVPSVPPGTYTVTATDASGGSATATFSVTSKSSTPTPTVMPQPTSSSSSGPTSSPGTSPGQGTTPSGANWLYPTFKPSSTPIAQAGEFWSPLTIGVVSVVVIAAFLVPTTFLLLRRGGKEMPLNEEGPRYRPDSSAPLRGSAEASRYGTPSGYGQQPSAYPTSTRYGQSPTYSQRLSRSPIAPRYGQTASYSRQNSSYGQRATFTKLCPQCKRVVRDDYNLCPYCDKRLR